jgi:hypothetical protein
MISQRRAPTPSQPLHLPNAPPICPVEDPKDTGHRIRCSQQTDGQPKTTTQEHPDLHQLVQQRLRTTMDTLGSELQNKHTHRQNAQRKRLLLPITNQMASNPFPRPLIIHVVVTAAMAPSASRCDGASATIAPVTTTSTAARTRERGSAGSDSGRLTNERSVPSSCPTGGSTGVFRGQSGSAETAAQRHWPAYVM